MSALIQKVQTTIGEKQNVPENFGLSDLAIFKPRFFVLGENQFDCYHFVMPRIDVPSFYVDGKCITIPKNTILATNPDQKMKVLPLDKQYGNSNEIKFTCMFIEKRRLQELAKSELGRSDLLFRNNPGHYSNHLICLISRFETESVNKLFGHRYILDCLSTEIAIQLIRELINYVPDIQGLKKYSTRKDINAFFCHAEV